MLNTLQSEVCDYSTLVQFILPFDTIYFILFFFSWFFFLVREIWRVCNLNFPRLFYLWAFVIKTVRVKVSNANYHFVILTFYVAMFLSSSVIIVYLFVDFIYWQLNKLHYLTFIYAYSRIYSDGLNWFSFFILYTLCSTSASVIVRN